MKSAGVHLIRDDTHRLKLLRTFQSHSWRCNDAHAAVVKMFVKVQPHPARSLQPELPQR